MDTTTMETVMEIFAQVGRWVRLGEPTRQQIIDLKWKLDKLDYLITPKVGWKVSERAAIGEPKCSEPDCTNGWQGGLQNFTVDKASPPVWFCSLHAKTQVRLDEDGNQVPYHMVGSAEKSPETRIQLAREMSGRWNKHLEELTGAKP